MKRFSRTGSFVPVILASTGALGSINTDTLPKGAWQTHSGKAPATGEDVHSLQSQKIDGTKNILLRAESGKQLSVTLGEAELFASDLLKDLGYTVTPPKGA